MHVEVRIHRVLSFLTKTPQAPRVSHKRVNCKLDPAPPLLDHLQGLSAVLMTSRQAWQELTWRGPPKPALKVPPAPSVPVTPVDGCSVLPTIPGLAFL